MDISWTFPVRVLHVIGRKTCFGVKTVPLNAAYTISCATDQTTTDDRGAESPIIYRKKSVSQGGIGT